MSICERIFQLMWAENSKQTALAKTLNVSASTLNSWKTRKTDPPAKYIYAIADFLGVSPEYLLTGTEKEINIQNFDETESELLSIYRSLKPDGKAILIATAYQEKRRMDIKFETP